MDRPPRLPQETAHHGIRKAVPIVGYARDVLIDYMNRDRESYCFTPTESDEWFRAMKRSKRITPAKYDKRPRKGTQQKNRFYDSGSYRQAVQRATKRAGVPKWTPAQIRHTTATDITEAIGIEGLSALLDHTTIGVPRHYARVSEANAIKAAKAAPSL